MPSPPPAPADRPSPAPPSPALPAARPAAADEPAGAPTATGALATAFDRLRRADAATPRPPDAATRRARLAALRDALVERQDALAAAIAADFGVRPREETLAYEVFPLLDQIRHARRHVGRWMRPRRVRTSWFLWPSRARVVPQPLGVVGVVGAWNYPLLLTLGPVVDALAAGNRVLVKPSEVAPRTAAALAELVGAAFAPDVVACVTGGADVAAALTALPLDHLCFTGSTAVGRRVMAAAAPHLTPLTLELGGKSPALVHESYPLDRAAERLLAAKLVNAGQTCVAPDLVLVPRARVDAFVEAARAAARRLVPGGPTSPDLASVVSDRHADRLAAWLAEAEARGARLVPLLDGPADPAARRLAPTLVLDAPDDTRLMQEEIFGPVLPVVAVDTHDDAIAWVRARPHPLALYVFDDDARRAADTVARTRSGGVLVGDALVHLGQHGLPFGGVGASGMGHYHGHDGFRTFSKQRGVMVQARRPPTALLRPPYTDRTRRLLALLLRLARR